MVQNHGVVTRVVFTVKSACFSGTSYYDGRLGVFSFFLVNYIPTKAQSSALDRHVAE